LADEKEANVEGFEMTGVRDVNGALDTLIL
jgi:hypothetical protein